MWVLSFALLSALNVSANDKEKATYVGGGRYVGEGKSVDDAVIRQRSDEYSERQQDRQVEDRRYERAERRQRDSDYQDRGGYSGDY